MNIRNHYKFDENKSILRVDKILNSNKHFEYVKNIPNNNKLTFDNGYYVNVSAIFIDIVGSSKMTQNHKRPTLAKIYRCFISESIALLQSFNSCKDVNINGDCVWAIFDFNTINADKLIEISVQILNLMDKINLILKKKGYTQIKIGIGIDYGKALLVKAGYNKCGINDTIWMGDVVNSACHLCNNANRNNRTEILISKNFLEKLNKYSLFFRKVNDNCYEVDNKISFKKSIQH